MLKAFGIMKAPTSEENAARWNQAAREWKQQADEHYEDEAPKFAEAGIPESAARYHTGRDHIQYQSDASMRSDPAFKRMRGDIEPSEREGFTDRTLARERRNQKEGTKRSLDERYPGDSLKHMEKASILKAFGVMKARSAANRAKNKRAQGLRRTKAEGRKLDSLSQRTKAVEERRGRSSMEYTNPFSGESLNFADKTSAQAHRASMRPADTAISIVTRNAERERQGKRPIKSPYGESFIATSETINFSKPETWTPEQQRLVTDSEKAQQREIARSGEQEEAQEARQQRWNRRQGEGLAQHGNLG
jgi:hypothetical protein